MSNLEGALELARAGHDQAESDLFEELRIPSVSTLPEHRADVRRNADWLVARFERLGFTASLSDVIEHGHPVLQADWRGAGESAPTLTIYGHYDVQPPDPLDLWESPPFEPVVREGHVFARGSSDNKGNHMAALKAAEYALTAGGPPLNLRFLIEGEEEMSGESLPRYLRQHSQRLKSDYTLIWDGGFAPDGRPALCTALRGIVYTELTAEGPAIDLHSGGFGGVAPNPLNTLARILGELKDRDGHITIPGFYDGIVEPGADETRDWNRSTGYEDTLKGLMQASTLEGEPGFPPVDRQWARPTLDVNGFHGGFTDEGSKTVIAARGMAKVSMRLVPGQDPDRIFETFAEYVDELSTPGVKISVRKLGAAPPVQLDGQSPAARATSAAFEAAFGQPAARVRAGGSVPVTVDFQKAVGGQIVCSGLAQPGSAAHSPNENFSLDNYHRGIEMLVRLMHSLT